MAYFVLISCSFQVCLGSLRLHTQGPERRIIFLSCFGFQESFCASQVCASGYMQQAGAGKPGVFCFAISDSAAFNPKHLLRNGHILRGKHPDVCWFWRFLKQIRYVCL